MLADGPTDGLPAERVFARQTLLETAPGAEEFGGETAITHAQRTRVVEIRLADVSPRFAPAQGSLLDGFDGGAADQRRAWFGVQAALRQRLQPWLDDGWEIVPSTLGPHALHIAVQRASHSVALPGFDWRVQDEQRYVSSATVLLQKPVHQ